KHFLPVSIKGIEEGDFTFVFGFPGSTDEYLPSAALAQILDTSNPARIGIRDVALKILNSKMRTDNATRIKYASKYARISNYHKKWSGESLGLKKSNAVEKRKTYETEFTKRISQNPAQKAAYGNLLNEFGELYNENSKYELANIYFDEAIYRNSETFRVALLMQNLINSKGTPDFNNLKDRYLDYLKGLYKDYDPALDQEVSLALIDLYKKNVPAEFLPENPVQINAETFQSSFLTGNKEVNGASVLTDIAQVFENEEALISALENDPLVQQIGAIQKAYEEKVSPKYTAIQNQLAQLQRTYMNAQLEVFPDRKFFPDANSTLRVTYGKVDGYKPEDKPRYPYQTYLDEAVKKHIPGDYEFDMPQKLIDLEQRKDYGV